MSDLEIVTVPKDLYYHEVSYVRGLERALDRTQRVLAMFIDPKAIENTTTINAYTAAVEAEAMARAALGRRT